MNKQDYQYDYTHNVVAQKNMYDQIGRKGKSEKIVKVLENYVGSVHDKKILEVSCSAGFMSVNFSTSFSEVHAIDIDNSAITYANKTNSRKNVQYYLMDALNLAFGDRCFDIVICNQMYEHVPNAEVLMSEIYRVLKPFGICYFGATNRYKVVETHYGKVPFLSWLPKFLAHRYLQILGKGNFYYETFFSYWGLKRLVNKFLLIDYTTIVVENPRKYRAQDIVEPDSWVQKLTLVFLRVFYFLSPGYIWLLQKPDN